MTPQQVIELGSTIEEIGRELFSLDLACQSLDPMRYDDICCMCLKLPGCDRAESVDFTASDLLKHIDEMEVLLHKRVRSEIERWIK